MAKIENSVVSTVKGRVSRTKDGRVGRFGWKGQIASLQDFVLTACSVELGLEVPGHHQGRDPTGRDEPARGLDLSQTECAALVAYVRSLPAPRVARAPSFGGEEVFERIGCASCHTPTLGGVDGIYSDLLLHDMGAQLADSGGYGIAGRRSPGEQVSPPLSSGDGGSAPATGQTLAALNGQVDTEASSREWRHTAALGACRLGAVSS